MHILTHFPLCHLLDLTGCNHALLGTQHNLQYNPSTHPLNIHHTNPSAQPSLSTLPQPLNPPSPSTPFPSSTSQPTLSVNPPFPSFPSPPTLSVNPPFPSFSSFVGALPNLPNYNALAVLHCPSPHSTKPTPSSAITAPGVDNTSGAGANLHPDFLGYHMLPDDQKKLIQMVLRSSHLTLILSYPHSNPTLL